MDNALPKLARAVYTVKSPKLLLKEQEADERRRKSKSEATEESDTSVQDTPAVRASNNPVHDEYDPDKSATARLVSLFKSASIKTARVGQEAVGTGATIISSALVPPAAGIPLASVGNVYSYIDAPDIEELIAANKNDQWTSVLPVVGPYKMSRRNINTDALYGDKDPAKRQFVRDAVAVGVPAVTASIGYLKGGAKGALIGGVIGIAPAIVGAVASYLTDARTDKEQEKASRRSRWMYLIPGYATYDNFKTSEKSTEVDKNKVIELLSRRLAEQQRMV